MFLARKRGINRREGKGQYYMRAEEMGRRKRKRREEERGRRKRTEREGGKREERREEKRENGCCLCPLTYTATKPHCPPTKKPRNDGAFKNEIIPCGSICIRGYSPIFISVWVQARRRGTCRVMHPVFDPEVTQTCSSSPQHPTPRRHQNTQGLPVNSPATPNPTLG